MVRRFRFGPQSGFHSRVSSRRPPNRAGGFPAPGSPSRSCTSHSEHHPFGTASSTQSAGTRPADTLPSRQCADRPVHARPATKTEPTVSGCRSSSPSLMHMVSPNSPISTPEVTPSNRCWNAIFRQGFRGYWGSILTNWLWVKPQDLLVERNLTGSGLPDLQAQQVKGLLLCWRHGTGLSRKRLRSPQEVRILRGDRIMLELW